MIAVIHLTSDNLEGFQLIRFDPIGRVDEWIATCNPRACFQLIRFDPIGRGGSTTVGGGVVTVSN